MKEGNAIFSDDGKYRYQLTRYWNDGDKILCFCMLNASNAGRWNNDPTVRRCMGFGQDWGYSGLIIVNLCALVSMVPRVLLTDPDPVGIQNDVYIADAMMSSAKIIVGWGNFGVRVSERVDHVLGILNSKPVYCFNVTKLFQPQHPLYVKKMPESSLQVYRPAILKLGVGNEVH